MNKTTICAKCNDEISAHSVYLDKDGKPYHHLCLYTTKIILDIDLETDNRTLEFCIRPALKDNILAIIGLMKNLGFSEHEILVEMFNITKGKI